MARHSWSDEAQAKPLTAADVTGDPVPVAKVAALAVITQETARLSTTRATAVVDAALRAALVKGIDERFASDTAGSPNGIVQGITPLSSSGDPVADLSALFAAYGGDLASARLLMHPSTAAALGLRGAQFIDLGAGGGSVAGVPVVTSQYVTHDSSGAAMILLDANQVALADGGLAALQVSREADVEMSDNPAHDSDTPTGAQLVSLWQTNSIGLRVERYLNWLRASNDAVVWIESASYSSGT